jgi:hypothetical protein
VAPAPVPYRPPVTPLAPDRYQITFTAGAETRANLEFAQDLLRPALANGDVAAIMDRALKALIVDLVKNKFAIGRKPRKSRGPAPDSRAIPAGVKRIVYIRDRGRCAFLGTNGVRCGERAFVEFHHHGRPWAVGGESTPENVQLRCRSHNQQEADRFFGPREPDVVCEARAPYGRPVVNKTGPGTGWVSETTGKERDGGQAFKCSRHGPARPVGRIGSIL